MISVKDARTILGEKAESMSDNEIEFVSMRCILILFDKIRTDPPLIYSIVQLQ